MFFPRLRRQAKWMFVFLAVIFGLGYVIFNVGGSIPGTGLGDVLQNLGQGTASGPSVGDAQSKIKDHPQDPTGYRELSTALQRDGKNEEAIEPLTTYLQLRPRDRAALSQLASLYLTQGRRHQEDAIRSQIQLQELTGADVFQPGQSSQFGQRFGQGQITSILANEVNQKLSSESIAAQQAYQNATQAYKNLIKVIPDSEEAQQPSLFLQEGFAAQSGGDYKSAIGAYKRFLQVAPDSPNAAGVRAQIKQLEAQLKAQPAQQGG